MVVQAITNDKEIEVRKPSDEEIRAACNVHGPLVVYEAFRKFMGEQDVTALPALGIVNPRFFSEHESIEVVRDLLPEEFKACESVIFYVNEESGKTRHTLVPLGTSILSFHDGFTQEDSESGWTPVIGMQMRGLTDVDIANEHQRIAASRVPK